MKLPACYEVIRDAFIAGREFVQVEGIGTVRLHYDFSNKNRYRADFDDREGKSRSLAAETLPDLGFLLDRVAGEGQAGGES